MKFRLLWTLAISVAAVAVCSGADNRQLPEQIDAAVAAGRWRDVLPLAKEQIATAEKSGRRHDLAKARHVAGIAENQLGNSVAALEYLEAAAADYAFAGADAEEQAVCADETGRIAHAAGRFDRARDRLREAIRLRMDAGAPAAAAESRVHLAEVLLKSGHIPEAGQEWRRALNDAGDNAAVRCLALRGLGVHAHTLGAWDEAVRQFDLAREEATALGADAASIQASLDGQAGQSLFRMGRVSEAETRLKAAAAWFGAAEAGGAAHLAALNNLAALQMESGRPEAARGTLAGILKPQGTGEPIGETPQAIALWLNLGAAEHRMQRLQDAAVCLQTAASLADRFLPQVHPLRAQIRLASAPLARDSGRPDDAAQDALEASRLAIAWLKQSASGSDEASLLEFRRTLDPVSPLAAFAGKDSAAIAGAVLASQGAILDLILARHRSQAAPELPAILNDPPTVNGVLAELPGSSVMIHFVRWRDCGNGGFWDEAARYGALVFRGTSVDWIDLGPAPPIDSRILRIVAGAQKVVSTGRESGGRSSLTFQLSHLRKLVWDRLRDHVSGARRILIRPDGMLHFVPWAVMRNDAEAGDSRYFCDRYPAMEVIAFPGEARRIARTTAVHWRVLAARCAPAAGLHDLQAAAIPAPLIESLAAMPVLDGVDREVAAIREALPAGGTIDARPATEAAFAAGGSPGVIHFAGHGFAIEASRPSGIPLMMAGLVMDDCADGLRAWRNGAPAPADADGILYASEVAGLTFPSAPLVVLSGCQTGLGHWQPGDHLTGLRRAFLVAGASAVASTLWDLSDSGAPDLVRRLYARLGRGDAPAIALWNAQREWLASAEARELPEAQQIALAGPWIIEAAGWLPDGDFR